MKIKATLFVVACLFCMYDAYAQWKIAPMYPYDGNPPTDGCESMVINDTAYVGSGNSAAFKRFDPATQSWIPKANMGCGERWGGISFAVNGRGYIGSGDTSGGSGQCKADFWQYDPATNKWTRKADFGGGARDGIFSFAIGDTGYAGGGIYGTTPPAEQDFWKYDPSKDQWVQIGNLPMGPNWYAATFVINNKAYVATGAPDGSSGSKSCWEYDPATGNWTQKADFPGTGRNSAVGFAVNGKGYVVGGMINYNTTFTDVWSYDPVQDKWTQMTGAYPDTYCAWMNGFVVGSTAYVGAGVGFGTSSLIGDNGYYAYDFTSAGVTQPMQPDIQLQAYPNPVNGLLTVQARNNVPALARIKLFDLLGNKMDCPVTLSGSTAVVNTQNLHPGVYFLHAGDSHGSVVKKIDVMER